MSDSEIFEMDQTEQPTPKPKRKLTEAQLAGLAKGRAKMQAKRDGLKPKEEPKEEPKEKPKTKAQLKKEQSINKIGEKLHVKQTKETIAEKRAAQRKANARKKVEENATKAKQDKLVDDFEELKYGILSNLKCLEAYSLCESKLDTIDRQTILDRDMLKARLIAIQDDLKANN